MVIAAFDDADAAAPDPGEVLAVWVQVPVDVDEIRLGGRDTCRSALSQRSASHVTGDSIFLNHDSARGWWMPVVGF